uniref:Uncharacterized protein n=1 Tax=Aegilops tauschii TaxID=37682 RepID=M8BPT5_AEGTA
MSETGMGPVADALSPLKELLMRAQCALTTLSLAILASLFVLKYKYHDPELQHPLLMALCVFLALCFIPAGFLCTQD